VETQKAIKVVAYNPTTEKELHFSCKAQCAKYFGLKANTVIRWLDNGMPVIELLTDQVEIEKQSKLNGFELFTIKEWLDYV
jgi:transposase